MMKDTELFKPGSHEVTVKGNRVVAIEPVPEGDELLGVEWAISEVKDSMRHSKRADGTFGVANLDELREFLAFLGRTLGDEAVAGWRERAGE
jgi:hypothetical protein